MAHEFHFSLSDIENMEWERRMFYIGILNGIDMKLRAATKGHGKGYSEWRSKE